MTTILGKQFENGFILAADSQVTSGDQPYRHAMMQKIRRVGDLWIAAAGEADLCDVVQHLWTPPKVSKQPDDLYHWMVAEIIPSMKWAFEKANIPQKKEDATAIFLIGAFNTLFLVENNVAMLREDGLYGIGTGSAYGVGAMAAGLSPEKAVSIAAKFDVNTGGRIQVVREGVTNA